MLGILDHPALVNPDFNTIMVSWFNGGLHFFEKVPQGGMIILDVYYFTYFLAFLGGYWLMLRWQKQGTLKLKRYHVHDLALVLILCVLFGAKFAYVVFYYPEHYIKHPEDIILNWSGMASHGALAGVFLGVWIWARLAKVTYLHVIDNLVCTAWFAALFIRFANFLNQELYGRPAPEDLPWAMRFPMYDSLRNELVTDQQGTIYTLLRHDPVTREPLPYPQLEAVGTPARPFEGWDFLTSHYGEEWHRHFYGMIRQSDGSVSDHYTSVMQLVTGPSHPSQLYQLLVNGVLLGIVMLSLRAKATLVGSLTGAFLIAYGIGRTVTEFFRQQDAQRSEGLFQYISMGQLLSFALIAAGIFVLRHAKRRGQLISELAMPTSGSMQPAPEVPPADKPPGSGE